MATFFTAQFGKHGVDITWRAHHIFSPTRWMVHGYLEGRMTWEEYREHYLSLLRGRFTNNPGRFKEIENGTVFKCYCRAGGNCHRYLLAEILVKCGHTYGGER